MYTINKLYILSVYNTITIYLFSASIYLNKKDSVTGVSLIYFYYLLYNCPLYSP